MKITAITHYRVWGQRPDSSETPTERSAYQSDIYPDTRAGLAVQPPGDQPVSALYLEIQTDAGIKGLWGPIEEIQAFIIQKSLTPFLLGKDPLAIEALSDQMMRMDRHGRSGMFMLAISAIDCALWDLKGKAWNQPVYRLLGGPTRSHVPAYASMLGFSIAPEAAAQTALAYKELGYPAQKWFFRFGPADGMEGKASNLAMAHAVREAVGPFYPLMFDAFMAWDVAYAVEMGKALVELNPTWLEEPVPPERVGALQQIRQRSGIPVATGEHVYTRWQVRELLERQAVDVVQVDPDWTGGISELVKVCAIASAFGVPVYAHGHSLLPALHVAASQSPGVVPMVEYLIVHQDNKQFFHHPIYKPEGGKIALPELPGLGLALDETRITRKEQLIW